MSELLTKNEIGHGGPNNGMRDSGWGFCGVSLFEKFESGNKSVIIKVGFLWPGPV